MTLRERAWWAIHDVSAWLSRAVDSVGWLRFGWWIHWTITLWALEHAVRDVDWGDGRSEGSEEEPF